MDRIEGLEKQTNHMMEMNDSYCELIENDKEILADEFHGGVVHVGYRERKGDSVLMQCKLCLPSG